MAKIDLEFLKALVGHSRLLPKKNAFRYNVFYVKALVEEKQSTSLPFLFSYNKWNVFSFYEKDHGAKEKGKDWYSYIISELDKADIEHNENYTIEIIAHPRIFGYAFNPITYWLISNEKNDLIAVMCEVRNTFKQSHNYLLSNEDGSIISPKDVLVADKDLYVSPFNKNEGHYEFRFTYKENKFKSIINYFDTEEQLVLNTYVGGTKEPLTTLKILKTLLKYPAMTFVVVYRIHFQAIKLYFKKVKHTIATRPIEYINNKTSYLKKK